MNQALRAISEYLTGKNIACQARETGGSGMVRVPFEGKDLPPIEMAFVAADDRMVFFRVVRMMYVPEDRRGPILGQINAVNRQWPCLRFFLDEDGYLSAGYEFSLKCQPVGEIAFDVLVLAMNLIVEVYPVFMKVIWG